MLCLGKLGWGHFLCSLFLELPGSVVCCLTLIWGIFSHYFQHFFCSLLSFLCSWNSDHASVTLLVAVPQFLDILFLLFSPVFYSFCFSVLVVSVEKQADSEILSSAVYSLSISSSKTFLIFVSVFEL